MLDGVQPLLLNHADAWIRARICGLISNLSIDALPRSLHSSHGSSLSPLRATSAVCYREHNGVNEKDGKECSHVFRNSLWESELQSVVVYLGYHQELT